MREKKWGTLSRSDPFIVSFWSVAVNPSLISTSFCLSVRVLVTAAWRCVPEDSPTVLTTVWSLSCPCIVSASDVVSLNVFLFWCWKTLTAAVVITNFFSLVTIPLIFYCPDPFKLFFATLLCHLHFFLIWRSQWCHLPFQSSICSTDFSELAPSKIASNSNAIIVYSWIHMFPSIIIKDSCHVHSHDLGRNDQN